MSQASCPQEAEAHKAVRTGTWEAGLSAHVAGCAVCREIVQVSRWMQTLAESPGETHALPDAGLLWWRAQLSEKQAEGERARKILDWAEFIFATLLVAGLVGWIGWNWIAIQTLLTSLLADGWQHLWATASFAAGAAPILSSFGVVIFSLVAIVVSYPLLTWD